MRKVVAVELVAVNGVMESPEEWAFSYSNDARRVANNYCASLTGAPLATMPRAMLRYAIEHLD